MALSLEDAARRLGMPVSEVLDVEDTDAGPVVTTHDRVRVLVTDDGLQVVGTPVAVPRDPSTGEAAPGVLVGELVVDGEPCEACGGTGRKPTETPELVDAGTVETLPPAAVTAPSAADEAVPDGKEDDVLGWVDAGSDPAARARRALEAEEQRDRPRQGLTAKLQKRLTS